MCYFNDTETQRMIHLAIYKLLFGYNLKQQLS